MATMTLGEFEREYGVNRGTVHKYAKDKGFETSGGLDHVAVDVLQKHFKVGPYAPVQRPQQPEETSSELVVVEGELSGMATPEINPYRMVAPSALAESFDDPLAIAKQFLEFGDQVLSKLDEHTQALEKRAEDTRIAAQLVTDKTRRLAAAQRQAEIKEAVASAFIQRDMAELQRQARVS
jgi:hypothetical protein